MATFSAFWVLVHAARGAWPLPPPGSASDNNSEEFDAFHGFILIKIFKKYKSGLHFTVICYTNKCIINERYIPEHYEH